MRRYTHIALVWALLGAFLIALSGAAYAADDEPAYLETADTAAIRAIYSMERSPMPWWTVAAFKYAHPDFDVAGFLAILKAESGLGVNCGIASNNPAGIKFGGWAASNPDLAVWHLWMNGYRCNSHGSFGTYSSLYWGQRSAVLLIYQHYNEDLATHDWYAVGRYHGRSVSGYGTWARNVRAAHDRYVSMAVSYGATW